jgi:hypothetical protein
MPVVMRINIFIVNIDTSEKQRVSQFSYLIKSIVKYEIKKVCNRGMQGLIQRYQV